MKHSSLLILITMVAFAASGCALTRYQSPSGERFSRLALGTRSALASLAWHSQTNGTRSLELRGYNSDSATALGAVTEAAVRAALAGGR